MKYVRDKTGKIEIMEDRDSISAGAETVFSTEPAVYEGTWDKPVDYIDRADVKYKSSGGDETGPSREMEVDRRLGTQKPFGEKRLAAREKQMGWSEPTKAHPTDKVCLNCGKPMKGVRPNRKFCSDKCRKDYSQKGRRAQAKQIKTFRPHVGKEGQIYYMFNGKIEFVPAIWCDTYKRAVKYMSERYEGKELEEIMEQIKGVIGK
jgi:predicted nucleic acid-binding Zn ribbon protein